MNRRRDEVVNAKSEVELKVTQSLRYAGWSAYLSANKLSDELLSMRQLQTVFRKQEEAFYMWPLQDSKELAEMERILSTRR